MKSEYKFISDTEKKKIIFQFILMLVSSVIGGICFSKLLSHEMTETAILRISHHFSVSYLNDFGFSEFLKEFFELCLPDIICISILLLASFTFINYMVTDFVLVFLGFRYGINSALLNIADISISTSLLFCVLRIIILAIFLVYSCRMAFYALSFRRFSSNGRLVLSKSKLISAFIFTLTVIGAIFIINGIYSVFAFVF